MRTQYALRNFKLTHYQMGVRLCDSQIQLVEKRMPELDRPIRINLEEAETGVQILSRLHRGQSSESELCVSARSRFIDHEVRELPRDSFSTMRGTDVHALHFAGFGRLRLKRNATDSVAAPPCDPQSARWRSVRIRKFSNDLIDLFRIVRFGMRFEVLANQRTSRIERPLIRNCVNRRGRHGSFNMK